MQRLGLSCTGMPTFDRDTGRRTASSGVCMAVFVITFLVYFCVIFLQGWLVDVLWYVFLFYVLFMGILLRNVIRQHFGIGPMSRITACDGMFEDCLLATFCSCCSGIQMARHTHDEKQYPYNAGSNIGLSSYAPDMWEINNLLEDEPLAAEMADNHDPTYRSNPHAVTAASAATNDMANVEIV